MGAQVRNFAIPVELRDIRTVPAGDQHGNQRGRKADSWQGSSRLSI